MLKIIIINHLKLKNVVLYIIMNLDCDTELIRATLINLREELKSKKERVYMN